MTHDHPRPKSSSRLAIFQFSCRTLLLTMVVVSVFFAWWSDREKLTKKVQRLDDALTVLQAALGDSIWPDSRFMGAYQPSTSDPSAPWYSQPPIERDMGAAAMSIPDEKVRGALYRLFKAQKAWLSQNLKDNRDWQEFIAAYPDPPSPYRFYPALPTEPDSRAEAKMPPSGDAAPKVDGLDFPVAKLLPVVRAMLRDGDSQVRLATMQHISGLEPRFTKFIPTLIRVLDDENPEVRCSVARALNQIGPTAKLALPRLEKLMNSSEAMDAVTAAAAIMGIDAKSDVVSRLTEFLISKSEQVPRTAASLLIQMSPEEAAPAMPTLFSMLNHKQADMQTAAAHAIGKLAPRDEAIDRLTECVRNEKDPAVKMTMARIVLRLKAGVDAPLSQSGPPVRRTQQLIFTSDDFRSILDEWERMWPLDQPSHAEPVRTYIQGP